VKIGGTEYSYPQQIVIFNFKLQNVEITMEDIVFKLMPMTENPVFT
jgi:hypothetical protein